MVETVENKKIVETKLNYWNIPVFEDTKNSINEFGKKGETYDIIIKRLLKIAGSSNS